MVSLFFLVFLQLDRFPVELAVPDFLAQRVIVRVGIPVSGLVSAPVSATFIPAFFHRQDRGDTGNNVVRFLDALFRHRGVLVLFGFGHVFDRADDLADLADPALGEFILRSDFLKK